MSDQILEGLSVLILEDEYLIAMDVEQLCQEHGASAVHIARNLTEAEKAGAIGLAVLDVMLGDTPTLDFARRLEEARIPFIFATGYTDLGHVNEAFPDAELVSKPYAGRDLVRAMSAAISRASGGR